MDNLQEIKLQNQTDCWSLMYLHLAGSVVETCGRRGEGAVREACRRYGRAIGAALRRRHLAAGVKTNLVSLCQAGCVCREDPRKRVNVITGDEQVRRWEVYTCPKARLWQNHGAGGLGRLYCEEKTHALVGAYTQGKGQANLSQMLTNPRDNRCMFSLYYRPANLDEQQRQESFAQPGEEPAAPELPPVDYRDWLGEQWARMYCCLLECAEEAFGREGASAVSNGLGTLAAATAEAMLGHAADTRTPCDGAFLEENFPLRLELDYGDVFGACGYTRAESLLRDCFMTPFLARLGLEAS